MNDYFLPLSPYLVAIPSHCFFAAPAVPPSFISLSYFRLRCDAQSTVVSAIETTYTTTDWSTLLATNDETECSTQQETLVTALDATIGTTPFTPYNTAQ